MMDDDDEDDGWAHAMREVDGVDGADALEDEPRQYGDGNDDDDADVFGEEARSGNLDAQYEPVDSEVMRLKRVGAGTLIAGDVTARGRAVGGGEGGGGDAGGRLGAASGAPSEAARDGRER